MDRKKICVAVAAVVVVSVLLVPASALCFLYFYPGVGQSPDSQMRDSYLGRSDHFDGLRFSNENDFRQITREAEETSDRRIPTDKIPVVHQENIERGTPGKLYVMWLGHSSSLVQLGDKNILIDPVLTDYSSPVGFAGVRRFSDVPVRPEDLPETDILLISHDHYDHLDYQTILLIDEKVRTYVVPLGVEARLLGWGVAPEKIRTLDWWEETEIDGITVTAVPTQHSSGRNPLEISRTLWCGYYFRDADHSVYYTGDGGYYDVFERICEKCGKPDLALTECGQYGKGWPMIHMFPEQTVQASIDVGAEWIIPVHWGAFSISNNAWDDSIIRLTKSADQRGVRAATPLIGERVDYDEIQNYQEHWWEGLNRMTQL